MKQCIEADMCGMTIKHIWPEDEQEYDFFATCAPLSSNIPTLGANPSTVTFSGVGGGSYMSNVM